MRGVLPFHVRDTDGGEISMTHEGSGAGNDAQPPSFVPAFMMRARWLSDVTLRPYLRDVALEVLPCLRGGHARHVSGALLGQLYETLAFEAAGSAPALEVGASYVATGWDQAGAPVATHWMYCTAVVPAPCLGIVRNLAYPNMTAPAPYVADSPFVMLEPLQDLRALLQVPSPANGLAEVTLGPEGWLIAARVGAPHVMGFLIPDAALPPQFAQGASGITIAARSTRTCQTIGLSGLVCASAGDPAIFLQEDRA